MSSSERRSMTIVQEDRRQQALGLQRERCEHAAEHRGDENARRTLIDVGRPEDRVV